LAALAAALVLPIVAAARQSSQQPVFRSSVELVALDVQVVDRSGLPIRTLGAGDFTVTINGQARHVVSANLMKYAEGERVARARRAARCGTVSSSRTD
jgi:hypothetical protein